MNFLCLIVVLEFALATLGWSQSGPSGSYSVAAEPASVTAKPAAMPRQSTPATQDKVQDKVQEQAQEKAPNNAPLNDRGNDEANARQARTLVNQAILALGGQAYLNVHDMQQQGRAYTFYHGRPTSNGVLFWRFVQYPDEERTELTPERDVAVIYYADKGYEVTYKGPHQVEKKDLDDYLRRRRFSLEVVLRTWINDPRVAFFYDGNALAGNMPAQQVTMINAKDEAVTLFFDLDTHLPIKKTYKWRDPVDRERNIEEEIFDNYRNVQGIMTAYSFTRYYNGDMQAQRFLNGIQYNKGFDQAMFNPNSGYDPNKPVKKH